MPAYVIIMREGPLTDPKLTRNIGKLGQRHPKPADLKPLAFCGALDTLEGPEPGGVVIAEFPSVAAARAWYDGLYQEALPYRVKSGTWRAFIVEGVPFVQAD